MALTKEVLPARNVQRGDVCAVVEQERCAHVVLVRVILLGIVLIGLAHAVVSYLESCS